MMHGMLCHYVFTVLCDLTETLRSATAAVRAFESATPETRVSDAEASRYPNPGPRCNPVITPLAALSHLIHFTYCFAFTGRTVPSGDISEVHK